MADRKMFRNLISFVCLLIIFSMASKASFAQEFDPHCYYPQLGRGGQIDSIYGSYDFGRLEPIINTGPTPSGEAGHMLITGLQQKSTNLIGVATGKGFNLHKLQQVNQTALMFGDFRYYLGHFRSPHFTDLLQLNGLTPVIYWQDESGNYDTSRCTYLSVKPKNDSELVYLDLMQPYWGKLTQDSVDDIILGVARVHVDATLDTAFLEFYRGGSNLYSKGRTALPDSEILVRFQGNESHNRFRDVIMGDWRGVGRKDLIAGDQHGNLFFYRNDPPFSLSGFRNAIYFDTIWTERDNPGTDTNTSLMLSNCLSYPVLPKISGDHSDDLLLEAVGEGDKVGNYRFYRGGPKFGSHRITLDSCEYVFNLPPYNQGVVYCGDMTGTGDPVLLVFGSSYADYFNTTYNFYVMGKSLDNKIDMYYEMSGYPSWSGFDTLEADGDGLTDVMIGMPNYVTASDQARHWDAVGTIHVVHGSNRIPVQSRIVIGETDNVGALRSMTISPNPCHTVCEVTLQPPPPSGEMEFSLYDLLGRRVYEVHRPVNGILAPIQVSFVSLPNGVYVLKVETSTGRISSKLAIVH
jgi:hypothetical protein